MCEQAGWLFVLLSKRFEKFNRKSAGKFGWKNGWGTYIYTTATKVIRRQSMFCMTLQHPVNKIPSNPIEYYESLGAHLLNSVQNLTHIKRFSMAIRLQIVQDLSTISSQVESEKWPNWMAIRTKCEKYPHDIAVWFSSSMWLSEFLVLASIFIGTLYISVHMSVCI